MTCCKRCHNPTPSAELTAYKGCCEDCWVGTSREAFSGGGACSLGSAGKRVKNAHGIMIGIDYPCRASRSA
jgi:hypothetical protein